MADLLGLGQDAGIEWNNKIDPAMEINADPEQMFRILMNLCRNAKQAMQDQPDTSRRNILSVSAEKDDTCVKIMVKDTGPGIAPHIKEKLFSAFQASTKVDGSGLGMTIALELARAHGGGIKIEETSSLGTTVLVTIPGTAIPTVDSDLY